MNGLWDSTCVVRSPPHNLSFFAIWIFDRPSLLYCTDNISSSSTVLVCVVDTRSLSKLLKQFNTTLSMASILTAVQGTYVLVVLWWCDGELRMKMTMFEI